MQQEENIDNLIEDIKTLYCKTIILSLIANGRRREIQREINKGNNKISHKRNKINHNPNNAKRMKY